MSEQNKYILVQRGEYPLTKVVNDCDHLGLCFPTGKGESLQSILKKLCAKIGDIPVATQVSADWNATSGLAQILNKPTIPAPYTDQKATDAITALLAAEFSFSEGIISINTIDWSKITNVPALGLQTEEDPIWVSERANYFTKTQADGRYLQSFTEEDPVWTSEKANYYTKIQADGRFLQTETDPLFSASPAFGITTPTISNWNTAFGWGNHAIAGYLLASTASSTYQPLGSYLTPNTAITGATKTKISYDTKGLVLSGTDATTADIAPSTNRNYTTDAQQTLLGNTSGVNTGDETTSTIKTKLGITTLSGANTGDQDLSPYLTSAAASSTYQPIGTYATASNAMAFTNKTGNISQWTNDSGYLTSSTGLLKASNLSDLVNVSTARTNLGLGGLATQSIGGSSGQVQYNSSGTITGASNLIVTTGTGNVSVGIGGTPNQGNIVGDPNHLFDIVNDNTTQQMFRMSSYGPSTVFGNNMHFYRSDGTAATPTNIKSGFFLKSEGYRGWDGSVWSQSAGAEQVIATQDWTSSAHGLAIQWAVTPNNSTVRTVQMKLDQNGTLIIPTLASGATAPTTSGSTKYVISDANGMLSTTSSTASTPSLTSTFVGVGSTSNLLSGSSSLTFDPTTAILQIHNANLNTSPTNTNPVIRWSDIDVTPSNFSGIGFQPALGANEIGRIANAGNTSGGMQLVGLTSNNTSSFGFIFSALSGTTAPTNPVMLFRSGKWDGSTNAALLAATENAFEFRNWTSTIIKITGDGSMALANGSASPNTSAILDLTSTTKGALLPRMTKTQRNAITSPATGLMVYQTDNTPGLRVYNGTNWMRYTETAD